MSLSIPNMLGGGGGGFYPSVFVTGLPETDTVRMTGQGKTYTPKWIDTETIVNPIPNGYTGLEYIESTGTQYIDTGVVCNNLNMYSEIIGNFTSISTKQGMGCDDGNASPDVYYFNCYVYNSKFYFQYGSGGKEVTFDADTNTHSFILDGANKVAKIDNSLVSLTVDLYPDLNIYLFSRNCGGSSNFGCSFKMQRATFKNGDTVLFDGIPCKRNSDNTIGLYDTVSQTFKTNSGTGTFTAGADKDWSTTEGVKGWLFEKIKEFGTYTITATSIDGTVKFNKEVLIDTPIEYVVASVEPYQFTADDFNSAQKFSRTSTFTYTTLTNQIDGSDGISITGRSSEDESYQSYLGALGRVILVKDLTYYSTLRFHVKKDANHGISVINILTSQPTALTLLGDGLVFQKYYNDLSTDYTEYSIDVNKYEGECYICIGGGYRDSTGSTSSKTSYCNVILEQ